MNVTERYYRVLGIRERIQQLQAELIIIADGLGDASERELQTLDLSEKCLSAAAGKLANYSTDTPRGLTLSLVRSIERVEERKRCAEIARGD